MVWLLLTILAGFAGIIYIMFFFKPNARIFDLDKAREYESR